MTLTVAPKFLQNSMVAPQNGLLLVQTQAMSSKLNPFAVGMDSWIIFLFEKFTR